MTGSIRPRHIFILNWRHIFIGATFVVPLLWYHFCGATCVVPH
eukprot:COSAG06_NODE_32984_length_497_cov_0.746231_2_plen_42_part_01